MASYNITTRNGNIIAVPDFAKLNIDGLIIIGDQTPDWNEPYNLNFIALDKKIQLVEQLIGSSGEVDLSGITDDLNSIEQELATVKSSVTTNTTSVASINQSIVNINTRIDNVLSALDSKVDKVVGKGLSTEDYTSAEKTKLAGLSNYTLPVASSTVLGGVKAGTNISIDANGVISANDTSVAWSEVTGKPTFSNVATSGSYSDLTNKPTVPTTVSTLVNDSGYQTLSQVNAAIQAVVGAAPAALDTLGEIATQLANDESAIVALTNVVSTKQDSLVLADFTAAFDLAK